MYNLLDERKRLKLSQFDMASGIGVSINTYINWERNVMNPNPENEEKIIAFFLSLDKDWRG